MNLMRILNLLMKRREKRMRMKIARPLSSHLVLQSNVSLNLKSMKPLTNKVYLQGEERKSDNTTTPLQQEHLLILADQKPGPELKIINYQYSMFEC